MFEHEHVSIKCNYSLLETLFYTMLMEKILHVKVIGVQWTHILEYKLKRSQVEVLKTFYFLNICHLKTIHQTAFLSFCFFDFINKIENLHCIHI